MNLKLQKRHRLIWSVLAVLLPLGFVSAYLAIPSDSSTAKPNFVLPTLGKLEKTVEDDLIKVNCYFEQSVYLLEVVLKKELTTPSTVLFLSKDEKSVENAILIGNLSNKKTYYFTVKETLKGQHLLFYDGIKTKIYRSLKL